MHRRSVWCALSGNKVQSALEASKISVIVLILRSNVNGATRSVTQRRERFVKCFSDQFSFWGRPSWDAVDTQGLTQTSQSHNVQNYSNDTECTNKILCTRITSNPKSHQIRRPTHFEWSEDVDVDGNGALDFLEFLVLMRRCDDIRDESVSWQNLRKNRKNAVYQYNPTWSNIGNMYIKHDNGNKDLLWFWCQENSLIPRTYNWKSFLALFGYFCLCVFRQGFRMQKFLMPQHSRKTVVSCFDLRTVAFALDIGPEELEGFRQILENREGKKGERIRDWVVVCNFGLGKHFMLRKRYQFYFPLFITFPRWLPDCFH